MNRQRKSLCLSILIHGLLLSSLYAVSGYSACQGVPVVLDFSITPGQAPAGEAGGGASGAAPARTVKRPCPSPPPTRREARVEPTRKMPEAPVKTPLESNGPAAIAPPPKAEPVVTAKAERQEPADGTGHQLAATGNMGTGMAGSGGGGAGGQGSGKAASGGGKGGGGSGGGITAEQLRMRYLREHFAYIRDLIQKNISYPSRARKFGWDGKVVVSFIIHESGKVSDERVMASSGHEVLDSNVISTIRSVSPFPKPPVKAELHIPIVYRLN